MDRLLLGLKKIAVQEGGLLPDIFADPAYEWSRLWLLSTSHCASPNFVGFGFGPVCERCVGVGYMVNNQEMFYKITSKHLGSGSFRDILRGGLREMKSVLESTVELRAKL